MDSQQYQRVQEIFHRVADLAGRERQASLDELCGGNEELQDAVARMLEADAGGRSLLDSGAARLLNDLGESEQVDFRRYSFGPYHLIRLLGEGGMGVVYLAEREDLGSRAAIKLLRDSSLSPMRRERFAAEQKMLAALNHPSIARLYDADTLEDGTPYIVMEYVEGVPLTTYVRERGCSLEELVEIYRSICEAVRYAHSQAIIHRDLKPSNVLVTEGGMVKLLDFGISKQLQQLGAEDELSTVTTFRLLTPAYAAPEQLRGEHAGVQADVYSLGVILYELVAGRLPYDLSHQTPGQIERTIEQEDPKPPSTYGRLRKEGAWQLPPLAWSEIDTLCLTAMHKDPARRYQSVEALIRDLDHFRKSEPLEARPDSFGYRASKYMARHQRALAWGTAVVLVLAAVGTYAGVRVAKARRETAAEAARTQQIERFMLNLFSGGETQAAPSADLRVATLLDRGVQQAKMLESDPETKAELDDTLAELYEQLGKLDRADPLLQSALEARQRLYGPESAKAAETMTEIGLLRLEQAKPDEAEKLTRQALAIEERTLAPGDPATAKAMSGLGQVLNERGKSSEAIPVLEKAVKLQSGKPGLESDLADSLSGLGTANYQTAHYAEAEKEHQQALEIDRQLYGSLHPRLAYELVDLGEIQHDLGNDAAAEKLYRQALDINKAWYGEKHPVTAFCMMAVGQSLVYQKRFEEAAPFIEQSVALQQEIFGPSHPRVAMALNVAGVFELRRGHLEAAQTDFMRMANIYRETYGDGHFLVGTTMLNVGQVYIEEKKYALAEDAFRGALDRFRGQLPPDHPSVGIGEQKLGNVLVLEQKYKEAEAPLLDAARIFGKQNPPPAPRLESVRKDLATVYAQLHEPEKAAAYASGSPVVAGAGAVAKK
jgi:serine/threonine protein kinase/tetratricopeptide (TPR) repeat protein